MRLPYSKLSFVLISASVVAACDGRYQSPQEQWSEMEDEQRQSIRDVVQSFSPGGARLIDVMRLSGVIVGEGERVFADDTATSLVVRDRQLELTAPEVLPQLDEIGEWDPTGGFTRFAEPLHAEDGGDCELTEDGEELLPIQAFAGGSLSKFSQAITTDTPNDFYQVDTVETEFELGAATDYTETSYNQQASTDTIEFCLQNEGYEYNTQNTLNITAEQGGKYTVARISEDRIHSEEGWETDETTIFQAELKGTYTRWRPTLIDPNEASASDMGAGDCDPETDTSGSTSTTTTRCTTVTDDPAIVSPAGRSGELEETLIITTTVFSETVTDTDNGCTESQYNETYVTEVRTYEVTNAQATTLSQSLSENPNHVITRKSSTDVQRDCDTAGIVLTTTTTITSENYTDNPTTRNAINDWRSTRSVVRSEFDPDTGETETFDEGTEWLIEGYIEEDPDIQQAPWEVKGKVITSNYAREDYFGEDKAGIETRTVETQEFDIMYSWAGTEVKVQGTLTNRGSSITPPDGAIHEIDGDWDGTLTVNVGGTEFKLSAEEWLSALNL